MGGLVEWLRVVKIESEGILMKCDCLLSHVILTSFEKHYLHYIIDKDDAKLALRVK